MPMSTQDVTAPDQGIFALFKGGGGSGKTVGAVSWPNACVLDYDLKMPAIARKHFPSKEIFYERFEDIFKISDLLESYWLSGCPHETLITDSITSLGQLCLTSTAKLKGEETPVMLKKLQKTRGAAGQQIEMMSIDYYNAEDRFIKYYIDIMKALWARPGNPKNVIFIAHLVTSESQPDLKTKMVTRSKSILTAGRKVAAYIPTKFDDEWMFGHQDAPLGSEEEPKRVVSTQSFGEDSARSAYNLPALIDFTNQSLYDKFMKFKDTKRKEAANF